MKPGKSLRPVVRYPRTFSASVDFVASMAFATDAEAVAGEHAVDRAGRLAVLLLVRRDVGLGLGRVEVLRDRRREEHGSRRPPPCPAIFTRSGLLMASPPMNGTFQPICLFCFRSRPGLGVVAGEEDHVGPRRLELREDRRVVLLLRRERVEEDDRASCAPSGSSSISSASPFEYAELSWSSAIFFAPASSASVAAPTRPCSSSRGQVRKKYLSPFSVSRTAVEPFATWTMPASSKIVWVASVTAEP